MSCACATPQVRRLELARAEADLFNIPQEADEVLDELGRPNGLPFFPKAAKTARGNKKTIIFTGVNHG